MFVFSNVMTQLKPNTHAKDHIVTYLRAQVSGTNL